MSTNQEPYTLTVHDRVTIVSGRVPIVDCTSIMESAPQSQVFDAKLAEHFNAVFVFGLERDCDALRQKLGIEEIDEISFDQQVQGWSDALHSVSV